MVVPVHQVIVPVYQVIAPTPVGTVSSANPTFPLSISFENVDYSSYTSLYIVAIDELGNESTSDEIIPPTKVEAS